MSNIYHKIKTEVMNGNKTIMITNLAAGCKGKPPTSAKSYFTEENLKDSGFTTAMTAETSQAVRNALESGELQIITDSGPDTVVIEPFFPEPRLIILGGGHIAQPLCEFGARLGFSVTVVDDRLAFANPERFPAADHVICESFETCFDRLNINCHTFIVIVTRGHRYDMVCLREVLKRSWAYAGMIGSRRRVQGILKQLLNEGFSGKVLNKLNAPIGLEIGAVTPEEIAISILGQVISYRRLETPALGRESAKISWTEFDRDVIEELSQNRQEPKALITIISTKGSVPRRAGAKMLVWPDGRILGSIGGGCSESAVIQTALDVIREGGFCIKKVDLTGSVAEDEGMVCGGIMHVLIEAL